jgi:hypothetical protein
MKISREDVVRVAELELTADYLAKVAEEKENEVKENNAEESMTDGGEKKELANGMTTSVNVVNGDTSLDSDRTAVNTPIHPSTPKPDSLVPSTPTLERPASPDEQDRARSAWRPGG